MLIHSQIVCSFLTINFAFIAVCDWSGRGSGRLASRVRCSTWRLTRQIWNDFIGSSGIDIREEKNQTMSRSCEEDHQFLCYCKYFSLLCLVHFFPEKEDKLETDPLCGMERVWSGFLQLIQDFISWDFRMKISNFDLNVEDLF